MEVIKREEKKERTVYIASDGKEFHEEGGCKKYEEFLKYQEAVNKLPKTNEDEYRFCKTEKEFQNYLDLYRNIIGQTYPKYSPCTMKAVKGDAWHGSDWYLIYIKEYMDFPDEIIVTSLSQKKEEFEEFLEQFRIAEKENDIKCDTVDTKVNI